MILLGVCRPCVSRRLQASLDDVTPVDLAVNLSLREDVLLTKLLGRRMCSSCGGNFNVADIQIPAKGTAPPDRDAAAPSARSLPGQDLSAGRRHGGSRALSARSLLQGGEPVGQCLTPSTLMTNAAVVVKKEDVHWPCGLAGKCEHSLGGRLVLVPVCRANPWRSLPRPQPAPGV